MVAVLTIRHRGGHTRSTLRIEQEMHSSDPVAGLTARGGDGRVLQNSVMLFKVDIGQWTPEQNNIALLMDAASARLHYAMILVCKEVSIGILKKTTCT